MPHIHKIMISLKCDQKPTNILMFSEISPPLNKKKKTVNNSKSVFVKNTFQVVLAYDFYNIYLSPLLMNSNS